MNLCLDCLRENHGHDHAEWRYVTRDEPCERCGADHSHEIHFQKVIV